MSRFRKDYNHTDVKPRPNILRDLERDARRYRHTKDPVLLCFTCDPYCTANDEHKITRQALEIFLDHRIPVSILTKGGTRCLQDLDLFKKFGPSIQVGATLTFQDQALSREHEPGTSSPAGRLHALKKLNLAGITTWASIEPVIDPAQSLAIMADAVTYVDKFKIGKLNHDAKAEAKIDWRHFLKTAVTLMRRHNKPFYIKKDLAAFKGDLELAPHEVDPDHLNIPGFGDT
jgi:DNA repair photolyase